MKIQHFSNSDESSVMTHTNCQDLRLLYPVQSSPFSSCSADKIDGFYEQPLEK